MADALAAWMPPAVMAALLVAALRVLWGVFSRRFDKIESSLEIVKGGMPKLASIEQLGRMGDRFDVRHQSLLERTAITERDIAVLREQCASTPSVGKKRR